MATEGDLMRRELKRHLLPALEALGFVGKTSNFQRLLPHAQDLLSIQYWKYGGSFILEFGRRERGDLHTSCGEIVPEARLDVAYLPTADRARLEDPDSDDGTLFRGFSFSSFGVDRTRYAALAMRVATLTPQVDVWLNTRACGSHVRAFHTAPD